MGLELFKLRNSSCSKAIDIEQALNLQRQLTYGSAEGKSSRLKLVNIGSGTTGTTFVFKIACKALHLKGFHWKWNCSGASHNPLAIWWDYLEYCIPSESRCKSKAVLDMLDYEALRVFNEVQFLMDSPLDVIHFDYAAYMKDALVLLTIRDPEEWALKRKLEHPKEPLMCNPAVYASGRARHPFDLISCLESVDFVHQAIMIETNQTRIVEGYVAMNTYNAAMAGENLHIMCVWDVPPQGTEEDLVAAWIQFTEPH